MPGPAGPQSVIASQCRFHTRWHGSGHLIVDPISSPVRQLEIIGCKAWVLSAAPTGLLPHQFPFSPILNDAFSKPHICDCLYCAFPRNHLGERGSGLGKQCPAWKPPKSLSDTRHFPTDLFKHSRRQLQFNRFKNQNVSPKSQNVPMMRQNLRKTAKVAKKSISSHKLFIIIVTSTIHYVTENNCKEISQDRKFELMHHHHHVWKTKTAKMNDLSNCLFSSLSICKLKWDQPCRFLVFQVEPKIYYFTDPDTMT